MIHFHSMAEKIVAAAGGIADRLLDHFDLVPVAYSVMTNITVLVLLPLIGILAAIPSRRRDAGRGLYAISYLFCTFVWASAVIADYHFLHVRKSIEIFLSLGGGLALVLSAIYLLRDRRPGLFFLGRRALLIVFILGPVLVAPVLYWQQDQWPDLVCFAGVAILIFVFRSAGERVIGWAGMPPRVQKGVETPV